MEGDQPHIKTPIGETGVKQAERGPVGLYAWKEDACGVPVCGMRGEEDYAGRRRKAVGDGAVERDGGLYGCWCLTATRQPAPLDAPRRTP